MENEKSKRIISAAVTLFSHTHDFRRVSLEVIAEKANVSPTTIYNNFGTRKNLVNEVIKSLMYSNLERNRALIHSKMPFPQKLIGIISGKLDMVGEVSNEIIQKLVSQEETIAPFVDQLYEEQIKPLWKEMVAQGKKEGYIDPGLDVEALLMYLDVIQAGFKARPELLKGLRDNAYLIEQLTRLMYFGFLKKEIDLFGKRKMVADES
jgi:TetR/AcrR family transcriptional regulator, cholesterol catabolism regulator